MKSFLLVICFLYSLSLVCTGFVYQNKFNDRRWKQDPDEFINTTELIKSKGYPVEAHDVVTEDGYILTIQRITGPRFSSGLESNANKPVALLQHGLLDASSSWVINFPEQSLGFVLADAGYDVWLGNMRGNSYGLRHQSLNPLQDQFWDFSWDEMSNYDLTAMVNYVTKTTSQPQIFYVGHSQGTLIQFAQLSKNKDLASKIKLFVALGPVATVKAIKSPIKLLADIGASSTQLMWFNIFGKKDFLPSSDTIEWLADHMCNDQVLDKTICENILFAFCGPSKFLNATRVSVYTSHTPAGTSTKNVIHFSQMVMSGKFQMFDYGSAKANMAHYNQTTAPLYDLTKVNVPVALYWAQNDWLADPSDVEYLRKNLPNIVDDLNVNIWDHLDFIWATNTKSALYDRMLKLMQNYL